MKDLHLKKHWAEQHSNVCQYISNLSKSGFEKDSNYGECQKKRKKFIFNLKGTENYFLPDTVVTNDFSHFHFINAVLNIVKNVSEMATIMLCHDNLCQNDRGNVQLDAGFIAQSFTNDNEDVILGMNLPQFSTRTNRINRVNDGENFTKSIIDAGCRIGKFLILFKAAMTKDFKTLLGKNFLFPTPLIIMNVKII